MYDLLISGKQRAGKDSVAAVFIQGEGYKRVAFADIIKKAAGKALSLDFFNEKVKEQHRHILIQVGDGARQTDPHVWIRPTVAEIIAIRAVERQLGVPHTPLVLTDARYPNEVAALKELGFKAVRLEVTREVRAQRGTLSNETNGSEVALDDKLGMFDVVVYDNGDKTPEQVADEIWSKLP